ncbi:MAG: cell division protein FtsL [Candidatus Kryptoniota bacterium]
MSEEFDKPVDLKQQKITGTPAQKRSSPTVSKFILILAGVVAVLLLIVNNSVTVDRLSSDIGSLESAYSQIKFQNDSLQAELKKLSSAERITQIASEKLGLAYSSQSLDQIEIDKSKLDEAEKQDARETTK